MSDSFTKLFSSIIDSTVWAEDDTTRIVWVTMLAMADQHGYVGASVPGLAARARKSIRETVSALKKLMAPDPFSRTKDHEGRRIAEVERGWTLLNYRKFRDARDDEARREYERERKREQRARDVRDMSGTVWDTAGQPGQTEDVPPGPVLSAQAEADPLSVPGSGSPHRPPDQTGTRTRSNGQATLWAPHEWRLKYGAAWCAKYQRVAYGDAGDSKGCANLSVIFDGLPEGERVAAQQDAPRMFTEFLARGGREAARRHPFVFFVQEWGGLRVPQQQQRPVGEPDYGPLKPLVAT